MRAKRAREIRKVVYESWRRADPRDRAPFKTAYRRVKRAYNRHQFIGA